MSGHYDDIDPLIETLGAMANDPSDDAANMRFADSHARDAAALLEELKEWRDKADKRQSGGGRVIVEGYDEDSMQGAFADALNKASMFFDAHHDIAITVLGLISLPKGGHRATLEVDITPLTHRLNAHPDALDEEIEKEHERAFAKSIKDEEEYLQELVHDHFLETTGATPHVPDYFLINFKDADLLNHMIEKQFFKAGHDHDKDYVPGWAKVKVIKPDHEQ